VEAKLHLLVKLLRVDDVDALEAFLPKIILIMKMVQMIVKINDLKMQTEEMMEP